MVEGRFLHLRHPDPKIAERLFLASDREEAEALAQAITSGARQVTFESLAHVPYSKGENLNRDVAILVERPMPKLTPPQKESLIWLLGGHEIRRYNGNTCEVNGKSICKVATMEALEKAGLASRHDVTPGPYAVHGWKATEWAPEFWEREQEYAYGHWHPKH